MIHTVEGTNGDDERFGLLGRRNEIFGFDGKDTLTGGTRSDTILGGADDDQLVGRGGNDTLDGGDGFDLADYRTSDGPVSVNLFDGSAQDGFGGTDRLVNIESAFGSEFNDTLIGGAARDAFVGMGGDDLLDGGAGIDFISYFLDPINRLDTPSGVNLDLARGTAFDGFGGTDTLVGIEQAIGSAGQDTLRGDDQDNYFEGRAGSNVINGRGGFDTASYETANAGVAVDLRDGVATRNGFFDPFGTPLTDKISNIEFVFGSSHADELSGSAASNETFAGARGNDRIDGRGGNDWASYRVAPAGINADLALGQVQDGYGTVDRLLRIENILGSRFGDEILGDNADNTINGGGGDDVLDGRGGIDLVRHTTGQSGVRVDLRAGLSEDGFGGTDTLIEIENAVGANLDDVILGDAGPNLLSGRKGDDLLDGRGGADTIFGGFGENTLDGGAGRDLLTYSGAPAAALVNLTNNAAQLEGESENILIAIEDVEGSDFADRLIGDKSDNEIKGAAGADLLEGRGGEDTILGGAGADTISGGAGADNASGGSGADRIILQKGADLAEGGFGNDTLIGGSGNDTLTGGSGQDRIVGGQGDDMLAGGSGADLFVFGKESKLGDDVIEDFDVALDRLQFSDLTLGDLKLRRSETDTVISYDNGTVLLEGVLAFRGDITFEFT